MRREYGPSECPFCGSTRLAKNGYGWELNNRMRRLKCLDCGRIFLQYKILTREEARRLDLSSTEPEHLPCPRCGGWSAQWVKEGQDYYRVCLNCNEKFRGALRRF